MNTNYTTYQNQQIAQKEYDEDIKIGKKITIDKGKTTIGYVSEIEDTASGFQAYVVTDVKLLEHPTEVDYAKVKHVTMLYRGSSGFNEVLEKPRDVAMDWLANDFPMAFRVVVLDWVPTEDTAQLKEAADFGNASLEKYNNATFSFYGHSLEYNRVYYSEAIEFRKKFFATIIESFSTKNIV